MSVPAPMGRLLEAHSRLGRETFAFDPAGNIGNPSDTGADTQAAGRVTTRVAVRLGGDGRSMAGRLMDKLLKDYAGTHYTWDERGNLVERSRNGEKTTFTWDGFNRMRSAETFRRDHKLQLRRTGPAHRQAKLTRDDPVRLGRRHAGLREHAEHRGSAGTGMARRPRALPPRAPTPRREG